jgi:hypothetical protein
MLAVCVALGSAKLFELAGLFSVIAAFAQPSISDEWRNLLAEHLGKPITIQAEDKTIDSEFGKGKRIRS